jgi:predicted DNA-binding protein (MmcQ/YjbR family)
MNIEELREFCLSLPGTTEDIKWENNLVFSVGGKMYCLADLNPPLHVALKIPEEMFDEMTASPGVIQASHFARRMWIGITDETRFSRPEWDALIRQSYALVAAKLPKKVRAGIETFPHSHIS